MLKLIAALTLFGALAVSPNADAAEREVTFSVDGQAVHGTLVLPDGTQAPPVALLLPGFGGTRNEWTSPHVPKGLFGQAADVLAQNGIASLRIDFRGSGTSDGQFVDVTVESEVADATAALGFLRQSTDVDGKRIAVVGMSLGGVVASALARQEGNGLVSVVLWNPGINPPAAFAALFGVDQIRRGLGAGTEPVDFSLPNGKTLPLKRAFLESLYRIVPAAEIVAYQGPLMVAVGTKDDLVFPQPVSAEALLSYHSGNHELWTRPVDHGFDADRTGDDVTALTEATADFLQRNFR